MSNDAMSQEDVDNWVRSNAEEDAYSLLDEQLPGMRGRLNRMDAQIRKLLFEVREQFPEAVYYTASGGLTLLLGKPHDDSGRPQAQRYAWGGRASISDGDY